MNSRRQRYFRARSPSGREMDVLEPADLVMEGDAGDDQRVSHEEIVDDGSSEMAIEHHQMRQHNPPQLHYEERHFTVPPAPPRRPGRPGNRYTTQTMPMDVIQKLQSKSVYMSRQAQQLGAGGATTRISPGGARIVSLPTARKREAEGNAGMMLKRMAPPPPQPQHHLHQQPHHQQAQNQQYTVRNIPMQRIEHPKDRVKVVRLVPNASRPTPQMAEQAILDIDERIKQTIEDSKCDLEKVKELQEQEMSPDEYGQMLVWLMGEVDRLNAANISLTDYYRQRQRHEKTIFEAREDMFSARIRQLEQENRKLREGMLVMYNARFENYDQSMMRHEEVQQHEEHMGPIMEGEAEHVVIEHGDKEEVPPEWIVEETVDDIHMHPEQVQVVHQEHPESQNNKPKLEGVGQFDQSQ